MAIKAIIWDMDGVLADSEPLWEEMTFIYLGRKGIPIPKNFEDLAVRYMKGRDLRQVTRFTKKYFNITDTLAGIHHERIRIILKLLRKKLHQVPYALQTLKTVGKKYPQALVSSSPRIVVETSLRKLNMRKLFTTILAGNEVRVAKPNPYIFLKAARQLKVKPSECVVIEDSLAGVQAAKRAKMTCIVLKTSYTLPIQRRLADVTISSLKQLPQVLNTL